MTKFRFHRGGLKESLETTIEVKDREELIEKILEAVPQLFSVGPCKVDPNAIAAAFQCIPYGGIDERCGWDTYLITIMGLPMGMTDGPI